MSDNEKDFKPAVEFDPASMEVKKVIEDKEPIRIDTEETGGGHHHEHSSGEHHHEHHHERSSGEHHHEHHHEHSSGEHHHSIDSSRSSSGEHHHHHHHHHHEEKKSGWKKFASWCEKNKVKVIVFSSLALLAVILLLFLTIGVKDKLWNSKNKFSLTQEGNAVTFTQCNAERILIAYGHTETNISQNEALECLNDLSETVEYKALYNGDYTCTAIYSDGKRENLWFTVDANDEPLALSTQGGMIALKTNPGFTVKDLFYAYGQHLGVPDADYYPQEYSKATIASLGNGIHTLRITAEKNGETRVYYQAITVEDCVSPGVLLLGNRVGVFCYGFDVAKVTFAKGEYTTLSEILQNEPIAAPINAAIPLENFDIGTYTFCFETPERDYFVTFKKK